MVRHGVLTMPPLHIKNRSKAWLDAMLNTFSVMHGHSYSFGMVSSPCHLCTLKTDPVVIFHPLQRSGGTACAQHLFCAEVGIQGGGSFKCLQA